MSTILSASSPLVYVPTDQVPEDEECPVCLDKKNENETVHWGAHEIDAKPSHFIHLECIDVARETFEKCSICRTPLNQKSIVSLQAEHLGFALPEENSPDLIPVQRMAPSRRAEKIRNIAGVIAGLVVGGGVGAGCWFATKAIMSTTTPFGMLPIILGGSLVMVGATTASMFITQRSVASCCYTIEFT